ncbi:MAG: hypothetical protein J7K40_10740 [candidate division Zixibacteria bacterium]|nr:hypothetical protein [candidate division Zixibacteria bacterium]
MMTTQQQRKNLNSSIELSLAPKEYDASKSVKFNSKEIQFGDFEPTLKKHNYSLIKWKDGNRDGTKFLYSNGFIIDVDEGLKISDAEASLKSHNLNYFLITSKSHTTHKHKFHILVFFNHRVYSKKTYASIGEHIVKILIPESDPSVSDKARFIFGSPDNAIVSSNFQGDNFDVIRHGAVWDRHLEILTCKDDILDPLSVKRKTQIYCPFHQDNTPSAFIEYSKTSKNWFIRCSTCNQTFWMEKLDLPIRCNPYWSYGTDVFELGLVNEEFYIEKIGKSKFHILTDTNYSPNEKTKAFDYLVNSKHISHLSRIDYVGDIQAEESYYRLNLDSGIIEVHHAPLPIVEKDNDFIEGYLEDRFGQYKQFIKEYLAVFCYTNYQKLPTLIFKGSRGNGKSTFAEILGEIYHPLTCEWQGHEESFTYEVEKKLLIVEENESSKMSQYKTLKKYTGQKYATVNKKFKDPYKVRNNMNIILLTNENIPLYVSREEQPKDEYNNQFFVFEFPEIAPPMDPKIQDKILKRLGYYIRTEIRSVFDNLNNIGYRYSIKAPITDAEKALFEDNVTDLEADTDRCLQKLVLDYSEDGGGDYSDFIEENYIPIRYFRNDIYTTSHYNRIIKNLKKRKYLTGKPIRKQVSEKREYCYEITTKFKNELNRAKVSAQSGQNSAHKKSL